MPDGYGGSVRWRDEVFRPNGIIIDIECCFEHDGGLGGGVLCLLWA